MLSKKANALRVARAGWGWGLGRKEEGGKFLFKTLIKPATAADAAAAAVAKHLHSILCCVSKLSTMGTVGSKLVCGQVPAI